MSSFSKTGKAFPLALVVDDKPMECLSTSNIEDIGAGKDEENEDLIPLLTGLGVVSDAIMPPPALTDFSSGSEHFELPVEKSHHERNPGFFSPPFRYFRGMASPNFRGTAPYHRMDTPRPNILSSNSSKKKNTASRTPLTLSSLNTVNAQPGTIKTANRRNEIHKTPTSVPKMVSLRGRENDENAVSPMIFSPTNIRHY